MMNQLAEQFLPLLAVATALATLTLFWGIGAFGSWIVRRYRKHIYQTALYIANERPDLLDKVADIVEVPDNAALVLPARTARRGPVDSIHTVPRAQLEDHCLRMEYAALTARDKWLEATGIIEDLERSLARAERLRSRYWNRIKRVVVAERTEGDIFAALHPALARAA